MQRTEDRLSNIFMNQCRLKGCKLEPVAMLERFGGWLPGTSHDQRITTPHQKFHIRVSHIGLYIQLFSLGLRRRNARQGHTAQDPQAPYATPAHLWLLGILRVLTKVSVCLSLCSHGPNKSRKRGLDSRFLWIPKVGTQGASNRPLDPKGLALCKTPKPGDPGSRVPHPINKCNEQ